MSRHEVALYTQAVAVSTALRDRTRWVILEAAAAVLAERGEAASMADIAKAAGIGRATVYRYFPTRDALLDALCQAGAVELSRLLEEAELDRVPIRDGIARVARAVVGLANKYVAFMPNGPLSSIGQEVMARNNCDLDQLMAPVHEFLCRGIAEGALRDDLSAETLWSMLGSLLDVACVRVRGGHIGVEQASADAISLFLFGAACKGSTTP